MDKFVFKLKAYIGTMVKLTEDTGVPNLSLIRHNCLIEILGWCCSCKREALTFAEMKMKEKKGN